MNITPGRWAILLTIVFVSILTSCGRDASAEADSAGVAGTGTGGAPADRTNEISEPTVREGVVGFTSGAVEFSPAGENGWFPVNTGQLIRTGDRLRTFTDSWCEIEFSDMSVLRLDSDTQFTIESIYDEQESSLHLVGDVLQGTVAAKVRRLLGKETLQLRTSSVVCAVRGTVFLVSADSEHTTVAVSEGRVALVPKALELEDRRDGASSDVLAVLDELEESMPVLAAGEEVVLGAREQDDLRQTVETLSAVLDAGPTDAAGILEAGTEVSEAIGLKTGLSDDTSKVLDAMKHIEISEETSSEDDVRVTMTWTVQPADTELVVNGDITGTGRVSGIWNAGESIEIRASRPGYEDFSGNFTAEVTDNADSIPIVLKKLPTRYFDINLSQDEAKVIVDSREYDAPYEGAVAWGETEHIRIRAEGYNERRLEFGYEDAPEGQIDVDLVPVIAGIRPVVTGTVIGMESFGNRVVVSDQEGTLIALDGNGERLWRTVTANAPNDTARPHRIGDQVFFSGINEFLIMESQTGREISRSSQDPSTMHLFGRRSVPFGNLAVYPAKDALVYLDPSTGRESLRAPIPEGGQMTPVVYRNTIWTVATDGTLYGFDRNGRMVGEIRTGAGNPIGHAPAILGSRVYFGDRNGRILAVDLESESVLWSADVGRAVQDDPAISDGNLIIYANHDVFVLDRRSGRLRYPSIKAFSAPPVVADGFLYGGTESGEILVMNVATGEIVARETINGQISCGGTVVNGQIVLGTNQGELLTLNPQHPSLLEVGPEPAEER